MQIVRIGDGSTEQHSAENDRREGGQSGAHGRSRVSSAACIRAPVKLCAAIVENDPHATQMLIDGLTEGIGFLESATGRLFGDRRRPLLVSVRSGAARSMPGMLETVLNVGCTPAAVHGLVRMTGHPRFAWDCRRRFLESYASVRSRRRPGDICSAGRRIGRR